MEEGFLLRQEGEQGAARWKAVGGEMRRVSFIAGPMVVVHISQSSLQLVSISIVGHLGRLPLASTALAMSLAGVTGYSLLLGMASALETLCGQAYGAEQYWKLGTQTYTAIFSLILVCIPISCLWIYMGKILSFTGQDPLISHEAGQFAVFLTPSLFAYATLEALIRYFQTQNLTYPMVFSSIASLCLHVPLCWVLVFKSGLLNLGAAVAMAISMWLNVIFLALYMKFSPSCAKTRSPVSMQVFRGIGEFFRFAIPSAGMVCLEWWAFELLVLLSGFLPKPALETSVLSICLTTAGTLYAIPYGIGAAASTRVSNELGAGNPRRARLALLAVMFVAATAAVTIGSITFATRNALGYAFSNDKQVIDHVTSMVPLLCTSIIVDNLQAALCGVARGCGWQDMASFVVLGAFYLFGIPVAAWLGFWVDMKGRGLWIGILAGAALQTVLLAIVAFLTDWDKQETKARQRITPI